MYVATAKTAGFKQMPDEGKASEDDIYLYMRDSIAELQHLATVYHARGRYEQAQEIVRLIEKLKTEQSSKSDS
jgi:hypothetical protein